jgi:hypothetical protein
VGGGGEGGACIVCDMSEPAQDVVAQQVNVWFCKMYVEFINEPVAFVQFICIRDTGSSSMSNTN